MKSIKKVVIKDEQGFILPFILMIGFLIISLLLGIFTAIYFRNILEIKKINKKKLDLACYSAVQKHMFMAGKSLAPGAYTTNIDSINVTVEYRMKGLYLEVEATGKKNRDSSKLNCLFAQEVPGLFQNAVIFSRPNVDIWAAGETKINGDIAVNNGKISIGNIFGIKNINGNFLSGRIKTDLNIKPKLFRDSLIKSLFSNHGLRGADIQNENLNISFDELLLKKNLYVSGNLLINGDLRKRSYNTVKVHAGGVINISDNSTSGIDIEVMSDSSVVIGRNSNLQNMVIISRGKILIKEGSVLKNVQIFSLGGIEVNGSLLLYPSVVCVYQKSNSRDKAESLLEMKSSIINGSALFVQEFTGVSQKKNRIFIDKNSTVHGLVYSEAYSEIAGRVKGIVCSSSFYYYNPPSEYINWMVNINVDRNQLDKSYLLPAGFEGNGKFKILKETWIY